MNDEPDEPPRRYRWPWFVLAGLLIGIISTVIWMTVEVKRLERERDFSAPPTGGASAHGN